jgi:hypothetical protein
MATVLRVKLDVSNRHAKRGILVNAHDSGKKQMIHLKSIINRLIHYKIDLPHFPSLLYSIVINF